MSLKLKEAQTKDQAKVERRFEARLMRRTIGCVPRAISPVITVEKAQHETPCESIRRIRSDAQKDGTQ